MVILSELRGNPRTNVTDAAEVLAAELISLFALARWGGPNPVFVEHHNRAGKGGCEDGDSFSLVASSDYEVRQRTLGGVPRRTVGASARSPLDRPSVERLVGGPL